MLNIKRILNASKYSIAGFKTAIKTEQSFRDDLLVSIICIGISIFCSNNYLEFFISFLSVILLLITELLNTGIEYLANRITKEHDLEIKNAKDVGSTAVGLILAFIVIFHICIVIK